MLRGFVLIVLIVLMALNMSACGDGNLNSDGYANTDSEGGDSPYVPEGYELVWADEFNTNGLPDESKWVYDTEANAFGWYNDELQYYAVRRLANSQVSDGKLSITAHIANKETLAYGPDYTDTTVPDYGGQEYTSARLITRGKADWTYGFFEIRAKMPCGLGTWPAIWMLGIGDSWPDDGEIDIMEHVGKDPTTIYGTIHNLSTLGTNGDGSSIQVDDACSNFHDYQLTWTPDSLEIGVDGIIYHIYAKQPGAGYESWPFDAPQYLILNLAIGGDMAGPVDDSILPKSMEVDYVRVYQLPEN